MIVDLWSAPAGDLPFEIVKSFISGWEKFRRRASASSTSLRSRRSTCPSLTWRIRVSAGGEREKRERGEREREIERAEGERGGLLYFQLLWPSLPPLPMSTRLLRTRKTPEAWTWRRQKAVSSATSMRTSEFVRMSCEWMNEFWVNEWVMRERMSLEWMNELWVNEAE